jgi:hypothetical protein
MAMARINHQNGSFKDSFSQEMIAVSLLRPFVAPHGRKPNFLAVI